MHCATLVFVPGETRERHVVGVEAATWYSGLLPTRLEYNHPVRSPLSSDRQYCDCSRALYCRVLYTLALLYYCTALYWPCQW